MGKWNNDQRIRYVAIPANDDTGRRTIRREDASKTIHVPITDDSPAISNPDDATVAPAAHNYMDISDVINKSTKADSNDDNRIEIPKPNNTQMHDADNQNITYNMTNPAPVSPLGDPFADLAQTQCDKPDIPRAESDMERNDDATQAQPSPTPLGPNPDDYGTHGVTSNPMPATSDTAMSETDELRARVATLQSQLDKTNAELNEARESAQDMTNYAARMKHDLENYKRRASEEQERNRIDAIGKVGKSIMPIIDDFERAIDHYANGDELQQTFANDCRSINKKLLGALARIGITQLDPTGEDFNPETAMAIKSESIDGQEPGKVFVTYQKGYKMGDKIIRAATVGVTK